MKGNGTNGKTLAIRDFQLQVLTVHTFAENY